MNGVRVIGQRTCFSLVTTLWWRYAFYRVPSV